MIPEKQEFLKEIEQTVDNVDTREKLIKIFNHLKGYEKNANINVYIEDVLRELFGKYTADILIPLKFHKSKIGTVIFLVMYGIKEVTYTVQDIVELTKTDKRPKGYSKQYIGQEIKEGNLKGSMRNGKYEFTENDVNEYLFTKGLKTTE